MIIRELFDSSKDIYRNIEKVIQYGAAQDERLKAEISEYIVTVSIERQLETLLEKMRLAMQGGENEIGVWVSGFYGSGKSSLTKYLGLAFDDRVKIDGVPFLQRLQDRLQTATTKALLSAVAKRFPAAVVMLDLASEQIAGRTNAEVSTVLYHKVLQAAGYSKNLKVAALEQRIERDNRWSEFEAKIKAIFPTLAWSDLQNDAGFLDSFLPQIVHELYPALYPTAQSFNFNAEEFFQFENERVAEMLEMLRRKTGKEYVLFVVDEVGQYVGASNNLILNLDGLAKNLKLIGGGKAWIISTAQQTLTADDKRAALNSAELYKLKDRFPIQVELESSDIKEICGRRLLAKSAAGAAELGNIFDLHGQALRHNTKLTDANYYDSDFSRESFINLYPFLPAHFEILLKLLAVLSKSTGGIGLRSAIKIVQDILIAGADGKSPVAEKETGWLATLVTFYDVLEKDIGRAKPEIYTAVRNAIERYHGKPVFQETAKSIAVLQILGNLPISERNIAALMQPDISHPSRLAEVAAAVEEMVKDPLVSLGCKDDGLHFFSDKIIDIERERHELFPTKIENQRILIEALKAIFDPLPRVDLAGGFRVTAGLKTQMGGSLLSVAGDANAVQIIVEAVEDAAYDAAQQRLVNDSRENANQNNFYLLGRTAVNARQIALDIHRAARIDELHRSDLDAEVKEYCAGQRDGLARLQTELQQVIKQSLADGLFVFRGENTATKALDADLATAARKKLTEVAGRVYHRYSEAAERVETTLAEKFLKTPTAALTSALDPLGLFAQVGGRATFQNQHKAVTSVRDFLEKNDATDGKRLSEKFQDPPFGWSADTLRYILAAMLKGGEIKLKIAGREVTTEGQAAIDALKNNTNFKQVGISLRDERPTMEAQARAAERLTKITGESVLPLEQEINKIAAKHFKIFQTAYAPLAEKLDALKLAGGERAGGLARDIETVLLADGSDATVRLGSETSHLFDDLEWAGKLKLTLANGLESTVKEINRYRDGIGELPAAGVPGELQNALRDDFEIVADRLAGENYLVHAADLSSSLSDIRGKTAQAAHALGEQLQKQIKQAAQELQTLSEWAELTQEERDNVTAEAENFDLSFAPDLDGLKQLLAREYEIFRRVQDLREQIKTTAAERRAQRIGDKPAAKLSKTIVVGKMINAARIDDLIRQLQEIRNGLNSGEEIEISFTAE